MPRVLAVDANPEEGAAFNRSPLLVRVDLSGPVDPANVQARIIDFLQDHPSSTAGDVAKALNANRNTIATRLSQMVKAGKIKKASKGYATK